MVTNSKLFDAANKKQSSPGNFTRTENGALTLASTGTAVLDLFSRAGAMRTATDAEVIKVFSAAYKESKTLATAVLFYLRDVLQGQGERRFFRIAYRWLADKHPKVAKALLTSVPEYGRWDDILYSLRGNTGLYNEALGIYGKQLLEDAFKLRNEGEKASISLAAKCAPSDKAVKKSRPLAFELMNAMGLQPRQYRQLLSLLRSHLNVVEVKMCAKEFNQINYQAVPSRASMLYRKAFAKQDAARYKEYIEAVKAGTKTIKAATLYPYDIVQRVRQSYYTDDTLELQWKALPHYDTKGLAVVDGSGSMMSNYGGTVIPFDVALSLGIYLAERNTSVFKDKLITFSERPQFIDIAGKSSLQDKIKHIQRYNEVASTNLQAVFDMILDLARKNDLTQEDMPDIVYIISDMEFNSCVVMNGRRVSREETNFEAIDRKYANAGYQRPKLVFWNVASRSAQAPAAFDEDGVALFSGCSPSLFKTALEGELNPVKAMLATIDTPRYQPIMELVANV